MSYLTLISMTFGSFELYNEMIEYSERRGCCFVVQSACARLAMVSFFATSIILYTLILVATSQNGRTELTRAFAIAVGALIGGWIAAILLLIGLEKCCLHCCGIATNSSLRESGKPIGLRKKRDRAHWMFELLDMFVSAV